MIKRTLLIIFVLLFSVVAFGQKVVKVTAEYKYVVPQHITMEEAKRIALDRAKIQAIADEFGTFVTQSNTTLVTNQNENSTVDFKSFGASEVKGEWIETIGDPKYEMSIADNQIVITVKVKGKIRELTGNLLDIKVLTLRNGTTEKFASTEFVNDDNLYLYFQAPVKGYLLVYFIDEAEGMAYQILPYSTSEEFAYKIDDTNPKVLFNTELAIQYEKPYVDEYLMKANSDLDYNDIYVLFSPNQLNRANAKSTALGEMPKQLNLKDFRIWLTKMRAGDAKLNVNIIPITVSK